MRGINITGWTELQCDTVQFVTSEEIGSNVCKFCLYEAFILKKLKTSCFLSKNIFPSQLMSTLTHLPPPPPPPPPGPSPFHPLSQDYVNYLTKPDKNNRVSSQGPEQSPSPSGVWPTTARTGSSLITDTNSNSRHRERRAVKRRANFDTRRQDPLQAMQHSRHEMSIEGEYG